MTLKELRLKSGLKVQKIAEQLGVSRSQVYFLETAKSKPDKLKIEKLSSLYECSVAEIERAWGVENERTSKKGLSV